MGHLWNNKLSVGNGSILDIVFAKVRVSSVSIVSEYGLDDLAIGVRSPAGALDFFPLASVSRPALGPTQPPVQWLPRFLSPWVKRGLSVMLTTHPPFSTEVENE
jgi:hypothetical protein